MPRPSLSLSLFFSSEGLGEGEGLRGMRAVKNLSLSLCSQIDLWLGAVCLRRKEKATTTNNERKTAPSGRQQKREEGFCPRKGWGGYRVGGIFVRGGLGVVYRSGSNEGVGSLG